MRQLCQAIMGTVAISILGMSAANAGDVTYFKGVPTADEVLQALGKAEGGQKDAPRFKTRAIVFSGSGNSSAPSASHTPSSEQTASDNGASSERMGKSVAFPLTFGLNSAELTADAARYVDTMIEVMHKKPDLSWRISGHADASGSEDYNFNLSFQRARTVYDYITRNGGIDSSRLMVEGKGETDLLPGISPTAGENRRVQFAPVEKGA